MFLQPSSRSCRPPSALPPPPPGVCGVDIYALDKEANAWRWVATSHPTYPTTEVAADVSKLTANGSATFKVHLPTYNSASIVEIGVPDAKEVRPLCVHQCSAMNVVP